LTSARQDAIAAVINYKANGSTWDYKTPTATEAWCERLQRRRHEDPAAEEVYKALQKTSKSWGTLDPSIADAVAQGMKEWPWRRRHALCPRLLPADRHHAEKHDSFMTPVPAESHLRVFRKETGAGRARRVELSVGRHPLDV